MTSALYIGHVGHQRHDRHRRSFRYRVAFAAIDVDELPELDRNMRVLSHNRPNLFCIRDRDYQGAAHVGLRASVEAALASAGAPWPHRITLVTQLRTAGYVFNPVSFFLCRDDSGQLTACVAEVNNTYGDTERYVLWDENRTGDGRFVTEKRLFVSPFIHGPCTYEWNLAAAAAPHPDKLAITMQVRQNGRLLLGAQVAGRRRPLTDRRLLSTLVSHPLMPQRVIGLIHWQAIKMRARGVEYRPPTP